MAQSNEPTIDQMNEVIALFDGYERYEDQYGIWFKREGLIKCMHPKLQELAYHTSWGALMGVVKKIAHTISMLEAPKNDYELDAFEITRRPIYTAISTIHNDAYQFITWYNQQTQPNATTENNVG